mmetsp:Transcript_39001/g.108491  ORF Transcript_39001/g.108491 Transcript_39001/m.108491 type:complete len:266 (-) Transcript_39001:100-897(-)
MLRRRHLHREERCKEHSDESEGQPDRHDGQHARKLREDAGCCPAPQHAEQHELPEDPHAAQYALHAMKNVVLSDRGKERACDNHQELRLEERAWAEAHGNQLLAALLCPEAEGNQRHSQDHEEGLHSSTREHLLPHEGNLCSPCDEPPASGPQDSTSTDCRQDADNIGKDEQPHVDRGHVGRSREANQDAKERERVRGLEWGPREDEARHRVPFESLLKLLHLRNHQPVSDADEDRAQHQTLRGRVVQGKDPIRCDGQDLECGRE